MTSEEGDAPLTESQRRLTAYVDDALDAAERRAFELAMAEDPALAAEVADHKALLDMTRSWSVAEPTDAELRRFWGSFYNRAEWRLGWVLVIAGLAILTAEGVYLVLVSQSLGFLLKAAVLSTLAGGVLLIWNAARLKMRTSRFDRYRGVMR
jgi:anti-sigma factor RsiW